MELNGQRIINYATFIEDMNTLVWYLIEKLVNVTHFTQRDSSVVSSQGPPVTHGQDPRIRRKGLNLFKTPKPRVWIQSEQEIRDHYTTQLGPTQILLKEGCRTLFPNLLCTQLEWSSQQLLVLSRSLKSAHTHSLSQFIQGKPLSLVSSFLLQGFSSSFLSM